MKIERELQDLNSNPNLNKDNVIEMMSKIVVNRKFTSFTKEPLNVNSQYYITELCHIKSFYNCTLLHIAAAFDCDVLAKLLRAKGANVDSQDAHGCTPLQVALEKDHLKTAKVLINNSVDSSCIAAYIIETSKLQGKAIAAIMVIIATAATPLALTENTELSTSAITGATIASMLTVGVIAYGFAYLWSKHVLSNELDEVKCNNATSRSQHSAVG